MHHRLDMTLAVAEALSPNKPNYKPSYACGATNPNTTSVCQGQYSGQIINSESYQQGLGMDRHVHKIGL